MRHCDEQGTFQNHFDGSRNRPSFPFRFLAHRLSCSFGEANENNFRVLLFGSAYARHILFIRSLTPWCKCWIISLAQDLWKVYTRPVSQGANPMNSRIDHAYLRSAIAEGGGEW